MFRVAQGQLAQLALLVRLDQQGQPELVLLEQQALGLRVQLELKVQQDQLERQDRGQLVQLVCKGPRVRQAIWAQLEQPGPLAQARLAQLDRKARQARQVRPA